MEIADNVGNIALIGTFLGSLLAAFLSGRTSKRIKTSNGKTIAELVEEMVNRNRRRTAIFLQAHVNEWDLQTLLREIVAGEFEEAEREDILRQRDVRRYLKDER